MTQFCSGHDNFEQYDCGRICMEQRKNELFGLVILLLPAFIVYLFSSMIEPLRLAFRDHVWVPFVVYAAALVIGWYLRKSSGVLKDHEWQRAKAMKGLKKHYDKEEKGMWTKEAAMSTELSLEAQAAMQGSIGKLMSERVTEEIQRNPETDTEGVQMLVDSDHVAKASRRVSGDENFDDEAVDSTIGAIRRQSTMDRFFDWIAKRFRDKDAAAQRREAKQTALSARAAQAPVQNTNLAEVHQKNEVARLQDAVEVSTVSTPEVSASQEVTNPAPEVIQVPQVSSSQSIEEMASMTEGSQVSQSMSQTSSSSFAVRRCQCGHSNPPEERFCVNCGTEL